MEDTDMTPDDIRSIRARLALTQEALAQRVGVSVYTVRAWEQGERVPGADKITRLRLLATSREVRAVRLTEALDAAAEIAEADAQASIAEGNPEAAEVTLRVAAHIRRLAGNHRESDIDPLQVEPIHPQ
jgi:transcriptional regulator with XRE-family HTH domain